MKYRKKPIVVDAVQYRKAKDLEEFPAWFCEAYSKGVAFFFGGQMMIETLEGAMVVSDKDYIVKGINGELYPCKPDIFEKTYEAVEDDSKVSG